jgi:hypothetical protein
MDSINPTYDPPVQQMCVTARNPELSLWLFLSNARKNIADKEIDGIAIRGVAVVTQEKQASRKLLSWHLRGIEMRAVDPDRDRMKP